MNAGQWDARIRRAATLKSSHPFASEGLQFYIRVTEFQRALYIDFQPRSSDAPKSLTLSRFDTTSDLVLLLPRFSPFLQLIENAAPVPLGRAASALKAGGSASWGRVLEGFWNRRAEPIVAEVSDGTELTEKSEQLLAWIFLQPYAEVLVNFKPLGTSDGSPSTCPLCGSKPIVGVLRPEGDGAKKSLICMLCAHEWSFRRVYCPSCGEGREPQMAFYSAPEIPHVRVDICDTCHTYLKTVDLTKTGLAVPVVDELATIPLDLWAREAGYQKLQTNILGA